jgi:hypothetical protein
MRIYLDSNIYQDFKREGGKGLYELILADKNNNIYCFSEAHIYDLVRDKTDEKFEDMKLMESVADNNCYYYDDKICFEHFTPTQYYNRFDWTSTVNAFQNESTLDPFSILKLVPLNFNQYIKPEQIPPDCPADFLTLLQRPTNLYEFCTAMMEFSGTLSDDRKKFKEFVKYLHANTLTGKIYDGFGIADFDGEKVTDKALFKQTYQDYQYKQSFDKHMNWVFANMYNGLELMGIVKGKPRKQQMMNMINDGKHSYFGTFCDVVVSQDEDFINKTKFLYDLYEIRTRVLSTDEFLQFLNTRELKSSLNDCIDFINKADINSMTRVSDEEGGNYITDVTSWFYGHFNRVMFTASKEFDSFYFTRESENWSSGTLAKEFEFITNMIFAELGPDIDQQEKFERTELKTEDWKGRTWVVNKTIIELKFNRVLYLRFAFFNDPSPQEPPEQNPIH